MKVGISMIYKRVDEATPNPGAFAEECEAIGLESVWVGDHMLFHAEPKTVVRKNHDRHAARSRRRYSW